MVEIENRCLLLRSSPSDTGIGKYAYALYSSLKSSQTQLKIEMIPVYSQMINELVRSISGNMLRQFIQPLQSALSIVTHAIKMLKIPKKFDIYHATDGSLSIVSRFFYPCVVTIHDVVCSIRLGNVSLTDLAVDLVMRNLKYANAITCVSKYTRSELVRIFKLKSSTLKVIPLGVDHSLFKPRDKLFARKKLALPLHKKILLYVGGEQHPRKNVSTLIKAFHVLQRNIPDAVLVRVGPIKSKTVQRLIDSLGLGGKVLSFSRLDRESVAFTYNAADVLVYPSYYEGFGLPILEAMASGCPVIASNRTAIPEVVGDAGVLLDPFDVDGFSMMIEEELTNEELRLEFVSKGLARSKMFSWNRCANETLNVYKAVLDQSG